MRKKGFIIGICVTLLVVTGITGTAFYMKNIENNEKQDRPVLTWIDDDTANGLFENAYNIAKDLDIKMTFAAITDWLTQDSIKTLLLYQNEGFQIVSHSATHDNKNIWGSNYEGTAVYDETLAEEDLKKSLSTLKELGFKNYDYFVTPGAVEFAEVRELTKKYCKAMIEAQFTSNINLEPVDPYDIHREFISVTEHADAEYYKQLIDKACEENAWLIFGTHSGIPEQWDEDLIREVLQYAIDKGMAVETLDEGFKEKVG